MLQKSKTHTIDKKQGKTMGAWKYTMTVLVAEKNPGNRMVIKEAIRENGLSVSLNFVAGTRDLLDYLFRRGKYMDANRFPWPSLILMDLDMPLKDGRRAFSEIKAHPGLRTIPIVVLTTAMDREDLIRRYRIGANSYVTRRLTFDSLSGIMKAVGKTWFEIVEMPLH